MTNQRANTRGRAGRTRQTTRTSEFARLLTELATLSPVRLDAFSDDMLSAKPTTIRLVPIHREARKAAERMLNAADVLFAEDPFVLAAIAQLYFVDWRGKPPKSVRARMREVRIVAHAVKARAVEVSSRVAVR